MEKIRVGWAAADISPVESVPLAGYGNTSKRMSQNIQHPLYANCIILSDEDDNSAVIYATDLIGTPTKLLEAVRAEVTALTGIPGEHVLISGSHTHSAPDLLNDAPSVSRYFDQIVKSMGQAAKQAFEDRKAAKMYTGRVEFENMNFIRHYIFENGTKTGYSGAGAGAGKRVAHVCEPDKVMQLVKFVREGGKDVILVNWQGHPTKTGGQIKPNVSSDLVGVFRDKLGAALDSHVVYYTGASGNVNTAGKLDGENGERYDLETYTDLLVKGVLEAKDLFTEAKTGKVKTALNIYTGRVNHATDCMVETAQKVVQVWKETNDRKATDAFALPLGIHSPYHANAIIGRKEKPESYSLEQAVVVMGDLAFATAAYEMFKANGSFVKDNSPCPTTMILTCANGRVGYIPSADAFGYIGYETDTTTFEPGTGEELADKLVEMIRGLHDGE